MPSEADLKGMLASTDAPRALDVSRIIRKSRARRVSRQLAAGGALAVAVAGIAFVGITSIPGQQASSGSSVTALSAPSTTTAQGTPDGSLLRAPADAINRCAGTLADVAPSQPGLVVSAEFASPAPRGMAAVEGIVRLTNTSAARVIGSVGVTPTITVSQGGIVLWHSNGAHRDVAQHVDLAPGASIELAASFIPVRCDVADDDLPEFRADLPPLPGGDYQVSAVMHFLPDGTAISAPGLELVTGAPSPLTLR